MLNGFFWIAVLFEILSLVFAVLKEKASILISGFNFFSEEEKENYNRKKMSSDMSNLFFVGGLILIVGIIISLVTNESCIMVSFIISMAFIIVCTSINSKKAFNKYKK